MGPFPLKVSFLRPIPENDDRCGLVPDRVEPESCGNNRNANGNHVISSAEESVSLHMSSSSSGTFARQIELHGYPFEPYLDSRLPRCNLDFGVIFYLDCNCVC